jgi:hypothetical protein
MMHFHCAGTLNFEPIPKEDPLCHTKNMDKRKSKKRAVVNEMAYSPARAMSRGSKPKKEAKREMNPPAVLAGILGDLKGSKPRAQKLSREERREISDKVALKRWLRQ